MGAALWFRFDVYGGLGGASSRSLLGFRWGLDLEEFNFPGSPSGEIEYSVRHSGLDGAAKMICVGSRIFQLVLVPCIAFDKLTRDTQALSSWVALDAFLEVSVVSDEDVLDKASRGEHTRMIVLHVGCGGCDGWVLVTLARAALSFLEDLRLLTAAFNFSEEARPSVSAFCALEEEPSLEAVDGMIISKRCDKR